MNLRGNYKLLSSITLTSTTLLSENIFAKIGVQLTKILCQTIGTKRTKNRNPNSSKSLDELGFLLFEDYIFCRVLDIRVPYVMQPDPFNAGGLGMGFQGSGIRGM